MALLMKEQGFTRMLVQNSNKAWMWKGLLGVVALVLCAHLIISPSHDISTFRPFQLTWIRTPTPDKLRVVHTNGSLEKTWKKSSCTALHHKATRWAYRNERDMLQAAATSHANFNTTQIIMHDLVARVAFLFLVRGTLPHEALWRRFFATSPDQNLYSVYVHANPKFRFPRGSFFHCKHIPSADVARFSFNMVDAMRRLLAHSLLDMLANNQRFVFVCEATIPIQSFPFTYNYLITSNLSYVQAFKPPKEYLSWSTLPLFSSKYLKKGEMWMSLTRRHASLIVGDVAFYKKFKAKCKREIRICTPDEQYIQTLLSLQDPSGLANKTIMYVDWRSHANIDKGSPSSFSKMHIRPALIQKIKMMKQPLPLPLPNRTCHLSKENASCLHFSYVPYLFARKFTKDSAIALATLSPHLLGY